MRSFDVDPRLPTSWAYLLVQPPTTVCDLSLRLVRLIKSFAR